MGASEGDGSDAPPQPSLRLTVSGTLVAWGIGIATPWCVAMLVLAYLVRY